MKNSIVMVFVYLTAYVVMVSAQMLTTWSKPYFFYHYNAPLALPPQKTSTDETEENNKPFSVDVGQIIPNTLESHVVLMSTCVRELKNTKADLAQTTQRLDDTYTVVENVKEKLDNAMARIENMEKLMNGMIDDCPKERKNERYHGYRKNANIVCGSPTNWKQKEWIFFHRGTK